MLTLQRSILTQLEFSISRHAVRGQIGDRGNWEGELEGLSTTGAWICFGGYLLETYSSTQQIVALSTTESQYILTKDVADALEIRSVLAECDMTPKMKGKTDVTAGRATAARRGSAACITWMRDYRGCSGCGQKA